MDPVPAGLHGVTYELRYQSRAQGPVVRELAIDSSSSTSFSLVVEVQLDLKHHFELTQRVDGKANGDPVSVSAEFSMEVHVQLVYSHASRFSPYTCTC